MAAIRVNPFTPQTAVFDTAAKPAWWPTGRFGGCRPAIALRSQRGDGRAGRAAGLGKRQGIRPRPGPNQRASASICGLSQTACDPYPPRNPKSRPANERLPDRSASTPGCSRASASATFPTRPRGHTYGVPRRSRQWLRTATTSGCRPTAVGASTIVVVERSHRLGVRPRRTAWFQDGDQANQNRLDRARACGAADPGPCLAGHHQPLRTRASGPSAGGLPDRMGPPPAITTPEPGAPIGRARGRRPLPRPP